MKIGDEVNITGEDGRTLTFEVVDRQVFPKDDAPIEDIFGYTSRRMLNVITCIGTFDHSIGGRTERLVVFTELKEE
ncbi:class F sortase [Virgibacillus salexigens]|uniref:class F sortase n=1 Tax=Virgibacillus salexigens TaxID=61016 RepID=UPI001F36C244|nr:class F sortase [Virgibacillus salexigens]